MFHTEKPVIILTAPRHSGKTTALRKWLSKQENISGIIGPVINGQRMIEIIPTGERKAIEWTSPEDSLHKLKIGRFVFDKRVFVWAQNELRTLCTKTTKLIVFDEVGYLELYNEGWEPLVSEYLNHARTSKEYQVLLVIRDELLHVLVDHYNLLASEYEIITCQGLS